jgi:hypothetical protein
LVLASEELNGEEKPLDQLVLVSSMYYYTSTPSLSTSWSITDL